MAYQVSRIGDIGVGICRVHGPQSGTLISGSNTVTAEGKQVSRSGDIVKAGCGHTGTMTIASYTVFVEGRGVARVGDIFTGIFSGSLRTGANTVFSG